MALTDPIFGPLTGTPDVEFAVLDTLEAWVPYMQRVVERRHGFPPGTLEDPPGRTSYAGGIDFDSYHHDLLPMLIAVVQPTGQPDRSTTAYNQWFRVEVAAIVRAETEDEARVRAGHMGTAIMAAIGQGDLNGRAAKIELVSAPILEFPETDKRTVVRSRTMFNVYVEGVMDPLSGPKTQAPPNSPQIPDDHDQPSEDWPARTVTRVSVTASNTLA